MLPLAAASSMRYSDFAPDAMLDSNRFFLLHPYRGDTRYYYLYTWVTTYTIKRVHIILAEYHRAQPPPSCLRCISACIISRLIPDGICWCCWATGLAAPGWNIGPSKSPGFPGTDGPTFPPVPPNLACIALIIAIWSRLMLCSLGMSSGGMDVTDCCGCGVC